MELKELIKFYMEKYEAPYEVAEQWAIQDWHYMLVGPEEPENYAELLC